MEGQILFYRTKLSLLTQQYEEADDAVKAAKKMHKEEFNDYTLIVEVARSQKRSDGACYACGKKGHL